jgi:hypothetical protein
MHAAARLAAHDIGKSATDIDADLETARAPGRCHALSFAAFRRWRPLQDAWS